MYYLLHTMYYLVENYCLRYLSTYIGYFMLTFSLTIFLLLLAVPNFRASLYFTTYDLCKDSMSWLSLDHTILSTYVPTAIHYALYHTILLAQNAERSARLSPLAACTHVCLHAKNSSIHPIHRNSSCVTSSLRPLHVEGSDHDGFRFVCSSSIFFWVRCYAR